MEEIKYKLNHGRGAVVSGAISGIVTRIKEVPEVSFSENPNLSLVLTSSGSQKVPEAMEATAAILDLVEAAILDPNDALIMLMTSSSTPMGVVFGVGQLLIRFRIRKSGSSGSGSSFGIIRNPHPMISLLRSSPNSFWPQIGQFVDQVLILDQEIRIRSGIRILILYIMCDPHHHDNLGSLRSVVAKSLIRRRHPGDQVQDDDLVVQVLRWAKINSVQSLSEHVSLLLDYYDSIIDRKVSMKRVDEPFFHKLCHLYVISRDGTSLFSL